MPGYLPRPGDWHEGQSLLVQVTAEARPDKGAVLTEKLQGPPAKLGGLGWTLRQEMPEISSIPASIPAGPGSMYARPHCSGFIWLTTGRTIAG